jgi:hypothetical protein
MGRSVKFDKGELAWCTFFKGKRLSIVVSELDIDYDVYDVMVEGSDKIHEMHESWLVKITN